MVYTFAPVSNIVISVSKAFWITRAVNNTTGKKYFNLWASFLYAYIFPICIQQATME
jgi:hypothetical protein